MEGGTQMRDTVLMLSGDNPGAMSYLISLLDKPFYVNSLKRIFNIGIRGTDIYVLWSDICDKDYELMDYLLTHVPSDIILDASSRQDYSGKPLVQKWIDKYVNGEPS